MEYSQILQAIETHVRTVAGLNVFVTPIVDIAETSAPLAVIDYESVVMDDGASNYGTCELMATVEVLDESGAETYMSSVVSALRADKTLGGLVESCFPVEISKLKEHARFQYESIMLRVQINYTTDSEWNF